MNLLNKFNKNGKFVSSQDALKNLEGKLLGLVDMLGITDDAKKALKAAVRQYVWGLDRVIFTEDKFNESIRPIQITYMPAEDIMSNEELGQDDI